ncbi:hypothetical protein KQI84_09465 [bacterium]|nr:hypothetical protein [bacterium]
MSDTAVASLVVGVALGVTGAIATAIAALFFRRTRAADRAQRRLWGYVALWAWICVLGFAMIPIGMAMGGKLPFWGTAVFAGGFYVFVWPAMIWALRRTAPTPT